MLHTALEKIYTSHHEGQPSISNLNISVISTAANKSDDNGAAISSARGEGKF